MSTDKMRRTVARARQAAAFRTYKHNVEMAAFRRAWRERSPFGPVQAGLVTPEVTP